MGELNEIVNFYAVSSELGTSGMPVRADFPTIAAAGYQTVINLARNDSPGQLLEEAEIVSALGMEYLHIPVVWENPRLEDVQSFFAAMDRRKGQKIFVHCVANYRVAVFVFLYRSLRLGIPREQAWADLTHLWTPDGIWVELIERVQDQASTH